MSRVINCLTAEMDIDNKQYVYYYRILERKIYPDSDNFKQKSINSYGIEIERKNLVNGDCVETIKDYIENVSPYKNKVYELLNKLHQNVVSPLHLVDVVGEFADDYVKDYDCVIKGNMYKVI